MSDFDEILDTYNADLEIFIQSEAELEESFSQYLQGLPVTISQVKIGNACRARGLRIGQSTISSYRYNRKRYPASNIPAIYKVIQELLIAQNSAFKSKPAVSQKKTKSGKKNPKNA